jgi:hypothetical protein
MELVRGVFFAIARLAGCTPASVGESPKWMLIVQNMTVTRRNLHRLLKGKKLYSALYEVYTDVLHDLTAILRESVAKGKQKKSTITAPPSNEEFCEPRRRKLEPTDDADERAKKRTISTTGVNDL